MLHPKEGEECDCACCTGIVGATLLPETHHVEATHTVMDINIAGEFWLAEEDEVAHMQMVDIEPDLTWCHPKDSVTDAHTQLVSMELDFLLGNLDSLEDDAHMHLESTKPEGLMNAEVDWLYEAKEMEKDKEVEEEKPAKAVVAVDKDKDPCINLQGLGVSHLTTLKGTNALTFPLSESLHQSILLRTESPLRSPATVAGTRATRESGCCIDLELLPSDLPPPTGDTEPPDDTMPEQIQAPTQVKRLSESLWGKNLWCVTGQDSQSSVHALEGKTPLRMAHWRPPDPADPQIWGSTTVEQNIVDPKA